MIEPISHSAKRQLAFAGFVGLVLGGLFYLFLIPSSAAIDATPLPPQSAHWAYRPTVQPRLPEFDPTSPADRCGPVDVFIQQHLQESHLAPSLPADKLTLLRRVTLDLTGLLPTLDEQAAYLEATQADAYERVVDRLLASPRYGERMAVTWLDLAGYADTHGYHSDSQRQMWRWRDWVVEALNAGMPFDQFTIEQLAGDLLPHPTLEQRVATGLQRNHMLNDENGAIPAEYLTEYIVDRVSKTGAIWLGQTLACARCHDHKHDPLSQQDFYQLYAFFHNVPENGLGGRNGNVPPWIVAPTRQQQRELQQVDLELEQVSSQLQSLSKAAVEKLPAWEKTLTPQANLSQAPPADPRLQFQFEEAEGEKAENSVASSPPGKIKGSPDRTEGKFGRALLCDGSTAVEVALPSWDRSQPFSLSLWAFATTADSQVLMAQLDENLGNRGFSFGLNEGKLFFRLTHELETNELWVQATAALPKSKWKHLAVTYAGQSQAAGVKLLVDGTEIPTEVLQDTLTQHTQTDALLTIGRGDSKTYFRGVLDEVQLFLRTLAPAEIGVLAGGNPLQAILRVPAHKRTAGDQQALLKFYLEQQEPQYAAWLKTEQQLTQQREKLLRAAPTTMVMQELPQPRATFILKQGRYDLPGQQVSSGIPAIFAALPLLPADKSQPKNRLDLARWLVNSQHPLTGRVVVNRQWQQIFGIGLVKTADDFGTKGEPPTHPELLDWLARDFVDHGWDTKRLTRQLVASATYRQSSRLSPLAQRLDPENRLLSHAPRRQLSAEQIRDTALQAAGLLDLKMGGPGVRPYQPKDLWTELAYDPVEYSAQTFVAGRGSDLYRRSVYTFWKRTVPAPGMSLLDAPDRETCTATRGRTNTPLQALLLLNDVTYVEAARKLAERVLLLSNLGKKVGSTDSDRLKLLFELVLARAPHEAEARLLLGQLAEEREAFRANPKRAAEFLQIGQSPADPRLPVDELAAWSTLASTLLNLDETLTQH